MRTVAIEDTGMADCVAEVSHDQVLLTRSGQPVALMIGLDPEQVELGNDDEF